jgi:phenylpyruvate tautomerase PptA (4-oxalocrotonate tautomerase family)
MLRCVGDTLARELGLDPGNVFVTYEEVDPARLYDAGSAGAEQPRPEA